jgi:hypothetical protein
MATARWRGSRALTETPDSPDWDFSGEAVTCTRIFEGPYDVCLASRPQRGVSMTGYTGLVVDSAKVKKAPGGKGRLTVTAFAKAPSSSVFDMPEEKFEIDWVEVQRALITNPDFDGGTHSLTHEDKIAIQQWEDCPDSEVKTDYAYYTDNDKREPEGGLYLSANAQVYVDKRLKGVDSWVEYMPVCRKTSLTVAQPSESAAGFINDPDGFGSGLPSGFEWLKTADRSSRTGKHGKWERSEEWTGAVEVDHDLYDEAV